MRLLIYGLNYAPEAVGVGKFTTEAAEWLAGHGHEVRVVTATPHYPEWRAPEGYPVLSYQRERRGGVSVLRCPLWLPRRLTALRRILCCLSFVASSFMPLVDAFRRRPDVALVVEPTFFSIPPAWLLGRLFRVPIWLHIQDFELDAALGLGMIRGGLLQRWVRALDRFLLKRMHRVSTLTVNMDRRLADLGIPAERRRLFPNWVDCRAIFPLSRQSALRTSLGIATDQIVLLYAGSLGRKHGLELLIDLAHALQEDSRVRIVIAGEGVEREQLERAARDLPNVSFLPLQPAEMLNELLNLADIHLLPQRASVADVVLPSKLTGMLASGRPVVATADADTELARVVSAVGIVTPPGDAHALTNSVRRLVDNPEQRRLLGQAARAYAQAKLDCDVILGAFEDALHECVGVVNASADVAKNR